MSVAKDSSLRGVHLRIVRLSLFEKVILANSLMLISGALAGLWVTSHNIEARHYIIDTSFIALITVMGFLLNLLLIRTSFRPFFSLLRTIRAVSTGQTDARASITPFDSVISELASAFNSMLDRLEGVRREQAMLILQAQEEERRRLALELHDESSQNLTALLVHIEVLNQALQMFPDTATMQETRGQLSAECASLTKIAQKTLETIHSLALQLRPSVLDLGLHAAFRWLAEDGRQRLKLAVDLHMEEGEEPAPLGKRVSRPYETALFRIAQESLTNVARHAHAQRVSMSLLQHQSTIRLLVQDDGCGYNLAHHHTGLGIFGMRERATLLGGTLSILSQPGQGTTVEAVLPHTKAKQDD